MFIPANYYSNLGEYMHFFKVERSSHSKDTMLNQINGLISYIQWEEFGLNITKKSLDDLEKIKEHLNEIEEEILNEEQIKIIRNYAMQVIYTLENELKNQFVYCPNSKILNTQTLVENIAELFEGGIFEKLSDISRQDFQEGGKCLGLGLPTASAFHCLRGLEDTLRNYYLTIDKTQSTKGKSWGQITYDLNIVINKIDILKKLTKNEKLLVSDDSKSLMLALDFIRMKYRNSTQHPDKFYNIHDAINILFLTIECCTSVIKLKQKF